MQHAIARQAEAERARRGKVINAEAEFQAAARLSDAADVISRNPVAIQLRYLQTLIEVSQNQSSTIIFPLPMDILQPLIGAAQTRLVSADAGERERMDEALAAARASLADVSVEVEPPLLAASESQLEAESEPPLADEGESETPVNLRR